MTRPNCPKCDKPMTKGPPAQSGKMRWVCRTGAKPRVYCHSSTDPGAAPRDKRNKKPPLFRRNLRGVSRFLITAAQNGTPVHKPFMQTLERAAKAMGAEIVVIPLRYKNPTSRWTASQANDEVWADEVQPYLCNQRKRLNKNLLLLGDIKTQPTATSPLTGFEAITHGESGIFGHTKLQLRTVPTPQNSLPKILTTTGACTVPNFTDSRAGKLGQFHNTLGACLVELDGGAYHIRQINADKVDGSFYDLDKFYTPAAVLDSKWVSGFIMGDTHRDFIDPKVWAATQEMIETLRPRKLVWHDVNDVYTVNPHHAGNMFNTLAKVKAGRTSVEAEALRAIEFIVNATPAWALSLVVPSNHPDMIARWIRNTDPRTLSPENLQFWCRMVQLMERGTTLGPGGLECPDPFILLGREQTRDLSVERVEFLDRDESHQIEGIEVGMHGDSGPNGARGSIKNLRRIGVRSVIGHGHSPGIDEGCYQVGTSTPLRLEYTRGPSSWLNTHCVIYPNGKRTLLNIIKGKWRA